MLLTVKAQHIIFIKFIVFALLFQSIKVQATSATRLLRIRMNTVSLLDIEPNNNTIALDIVAPTEAGEAVSSVSDNSKWLNYTVQLSTGDPNQFVTVEVDQVITGLDLNLTVSQSSGVGNGTLGTSVGTVTLTATPTTVISAIGGSFTGNGINNGHQLTYELVINDYTLLSALTNEIIMVTYTISD